MIDVYQPVRSKSVATLTRALRTVCILAASFHGYHADIIQPYALRTPEVIIGCGWGSSADIWNLGRMVFELLTGRWLFRPTEGPRWSAEAFHLEQMRRLSGEDFNVTSVRSGSRFGKYFDDGGLQTLEEIFRVYNVLSENDLSPCQHADTCGRLVQLVLLGLFLAFSETGSAYIGNLSESSPPHSTSAATQLPEEYFGLKGFLEKPSIGSAGIPPRTFRVFQLTFAAIMPILALDAIAECARPDARLQPDRMLDMEFQQMVVRPRRPRPCRQHTRAYFVGYRRARDQHLLGQAARVGIKPSWISSRLQAQAHGGFYDIITLCSQVLAISGY
ncbi:hypothetical protein EW146_g4446 [Bondarzewia mesenterica]|uniref:non-specific serine/threonine protein kinase n=1 Tax=Bondarzewia mesenterica TaxID=1095465 RepID=A0A4S4LUJ8_9AGAM|nr:hypothetical protein EW146_g4446 [Bondarzewia mesenterica]